MLPNQPIHTIWFNTFAPHCLIMNEKSARGLSVGEGSRFLRRGGCTATAPTIAAQKIRTLCVAAMMVLLLCSQLPAQNWIVLGPDGGDVRSIASEPSSPNHLYVGTSAGRIFTSIDGGKRWSRLTHLGDRDDYVLDHILVDPTDPATIFVSAWSLDAQRSGDVFRSRDGGKKWAALADMHGKSIRALAIAQFDPRVLISGALDGVYRSENAGDTWVRISPANDPELRNIESVAMDPKDPKVIYAGTWHLAWKTSDGGKSWRHINEGMVDDSDVFSIIIDPTNSAVVYASACSGIYKSDNGGESFRKVQGVPFSARRTRILKQDSMNPSIVYAGTTEGLWKTIDGGKTWSQMTSSGIVINDVFIDPRSSSRLLLATDRAGVLASEDAGVHFFPSNYGYTHRYVTAILIAKKVPNTLLVGLANDREWGGVFWCQNGGRNCHQLSAGLAGRDVLVLREANDGTLIAGTNLGVFVMGRKWDAWRSASRVVSAKPSANYRKIKSRETSFDQDQQSLMRARVNDLQVLTGRWLAATSAGLYTSGDEGRSWAGGPLLGRSDIVTLRSAGGLLLAATRTEIFVSLDQGAKWEVVKLPPTVNTFSDVAITPDTDILLVSHIGVLRSSDLGASWEPSKGLSPGQVSLVSSTDSGKTLLGTSSSSGVIFHSRDGGRSWQPRVDSGYRLRRVESANGHLVGATLFDGVIMQQ
jgi:photosystem II stability/assembly factor-like uncharacterized protein